MIRAGRLKFLLPLVVLLAWLVSVSPSSAHLADLPPAMQAQLQTAATNNQIASVALALAKANPQLATAILEAAIDLLGPGNAGPLLVEFADASKLAAVVGTNGSDEVAAALAGAVNVVIAEYNSTLPKWAVTNAGYTIGSVTQGANGNLLAALETFGFFGQSGGVGGCSSCARP